MNFHHCIYYLLYKVVVLRKMVYLVDLTLFFFPSRYGTALGVVRKLHDLKRLGEHTWTQSYLKLHLISNFIILLLYIIKIEHVYCTETRPYNQGARLTAFELVHDKLPATLILDSMVAALLRSKRITAVVVGADRVINELSLLLHNKIIFFKNYPLST